MPFEKGNIAWNKGIPRNEKTKRKISKTLKGKLKSIETKKKMSESKKGKLNHKGEKNPNWKGDKVNLRSLHQYIRRYKTEPKYCTICNEFGKQLDCCSIDHTYTRNLEDWIYLCKECHRLFDKYRKNKNK